MGRRGSGYGAGCGGRAGGLVNVTDVTSRRGAPGAAGGRLAPISDADPVAAGGRRHAVGSHALLQALVTETAAALLRLCAGAVLLWPAGFWLGGLAIVCEVLMLSPRSGTRAVGVFFWPVDRRGVLAPCDFAVLRGELWLQRDAYKRRVADAIASLQRGSARLSATAAAGMGDRRRQRGVTSLAIRGNAANWNCRGAWSAKAEEEALLLRSAVVMVRQNLDALVGLLKRALRLRTCALLWLAGRSIPSSSPCPPTAARLSKRPSAWT